MLVPGVLAVTAIPPTNVASVLLHVVLGTVRESSAVSLMRLFAVTAVVLIVKVGLTPMGNATAPSGADPQTAAKARAQRALTARVASIDITWLLIR